MKRALLLFSTISILILAASCSPREESPVKSQVKCTIFPLDCYTGDIRCYTMRDQQFSFTASFIPTKSSNETKQIFDSKFSVPQKEAYVSLQLADFGKPADIVCIAAASSGGFKLTCDKFFLGVEPSSDLSHLFKVSPIAELRYPDYSVAVKCYDSANAPTLYDFLSGGFTWMQTSEFGLYFEPVMMPDLADYPEECVLTFTLSIPLSGVSSEGEIIQKTFEGYTSINPFLAEEPDIV